MSVVGTSVLNMNVSNLRGVGEARRVALAKLGGETVADLISLYPRAYQNRGEILTLREIKEKVTSGETGPFSCLLTVAAEPTVRMIRRGMTIMKVRAFDETDVIEITYFNQQYLRTTLHTGAQFRFFGKFTAERSKLVLSSPITEPCADPALLEGIVPIYPLTSGLTQKFMKGIVSEALRRAKHEVLEFLPSNVLSELQLPTYLYALENIHAPTSITALERARKRLVFDELYLMFIYTE